MKSQSVLSWFDSNGFDAFEAHFNLNAFKVRIFARIIGKNLIKLICWNKKKSLCIIHSVLTYSEVISESAAWSSHVGKWNTSLKRSFRDKPPCQSS